MRRFLIPFAFFTLFTISFQAQILKRSEPNWLQEISISDDEIDLSEVSEGIYMLLYDTQVNVPEQTVYYRVTNKITDNVGIQDASTVTVSYDPSYQKLIFHKIDIIRNGQSIHKLDLSNFQEMRRELNAENYLYDGSMSAVMHISDVRTDDIIDYSYSIIGFNPIHKGLFSSSFYLNDINDMGTINVTILSKNELNYKSFNNSISPNIKKSNNVYIYNWQVTNPQKLDYEEYTPSWKFIYDSVFVSELNSWEDVANWGVDVYDIKGNLSNGIETKIKEIDTKHESVGSKIKATLDFVQDEVRYLGLESGIGSYKPFSPNTVFEQRFGDCKDKSLLMTTMLNKMGIEAYPMLVNTYLKQNIKELLPSPKFFDHCVVKVVDGNRNHYYDPTIANQGGDYDSTHFPDYRYGLVLKQNNNEFDEIKPYSENKIETFEEYAIDSIGKGGHLKVTTIYHEGEADNIRNYFKNNSLNAIKKEYEGFYSNYYFNVNSLKDPKIEDQEYRNIVKIFEEYKIDSLWQPMPERDNTIAVSFTPGSLLNSLYVPTKHARNSEISVVYPIIREHHIKVSLPQPWNIVNDKVFVTSPAFYYEWKVDYDRKNRVIDLYYYLKTLKDHVAVGEYNRYIQDVKRVDQSSAYSIFIPKDYSETLNFKASDGNNFIINAFVTIFKAIFFLAILIALALFIYWFTQKRSKS